MTVQGNPDDRASATLIGRPGADAVRPSAAAAVLPVVRGLDDERARFYGDIVLNSLNEAARRALEAMMKGYEYQSDFAKKYVAQGRAEARARATCSPRSGFAASRCRTPRASASSPRRTPARLERWLSEAILAASVAEVIDEPS